MAGDFAYTASRAGIHPGEPIIGPDWIEHRKSERHLTFKTGRVIAANGSLECAILNVSEHGACILVPVGSLTGDHFALLIDGDHKPRYCVVAWREGARIGVSYDTRVA